MDVPSSGKLNKLKLQRMKYSGSNLTEYKDLKLNEYSGSTVKNGAMEVWINPSNLNHSVSIKYSDINIPGSTHPVSKFDNRPPETLAFDLIFDGTNMIYESGDDVQTDLDGFKKLTYDYDGDFHDVPYLKITWGDWFEYVGRLTSLSIKYTLFDNLGNPVRATASCQFQTSTSPQDEASKKKDNSPDMTHVKIVKAGYGLRHMCYEIYGDTKLDVAVAKFNGFTTRYVAEGTEVVLPPLQLMS